MRCPYYYLARATAAVPVCLRAVVPFEPSDKDREYCTTDRHPWGPLYRSADCDFALTAHRGAAGAVG